MSMSELEASSKPLVTGRVIHKYPVLSGTIESVAVPMGLKSKVLHVEAQPDGVYVWVEHQTPVSVHLDRKMLFRAFMTGKEIPADGWEYVGTAQLVGVCGNCPEPHPRAVTWHVYSLDVRGEEKL